ncbi:MAG: hypothetical protein AAGA03_06860 [Planctomycetota bacterium]
MTLRLWLVGLTAFATLISAAASTHAADRPVFSGPQVGEPVPGFEIVSVNGRSDSEGSDSDSKSFDPVAEAGKKPLVLMFIHQVSRPGFGLVRSLSRYTTSLSEKGVHSAIIHLTDDPPEKLDWAKNVMRYFPKEQPVGVFAGGVEGPGNYGLNRNVMLTLLVAKDAKVTGNFAITQPQLNVDGPKIIQAIADAAGDSDPPTVEQLQGNAGRMMRRQNKSRE